MTMSLNPFPQAVGPATQFRAAVPEDIPACVRLRGRTRENAISEERLATFGITATSWAEDVRHGVLAGQVAQRAGEIVGYGFGHRESGEVVVLALLPEVEGQGVGRALLARVTAALFVAGHRRLFLGCSPDPASRSHGFYRHLGWQSTGRFDAHGDEVLELHAAESPAGAARAEATRTDP